MQLHQKDVIIGGIIAFYLCLIGMLASGIYLCSESSNMGWVCPETTTVVSNDDISTASTNLINWVENDTTFVYNLSPHPTRLPTQIPTQGSNDRPCENAVRLCVDSTALGLCI